MRGWLVALILGCTMAAATVCLAAATPLDAASTRTFITAAVGLLRLEVARHDQQVAAVDAVLTHVERNCSRSLPRNLLTGTAAQQRIGTTFLFGVGARELALAEFAPIRKQAARSLIVFERLHWSRRSINRAIGGEIRRSRAVLALHSPDLCREIRASAATGFTALPRDLSGFLRRAAIAFPDNAAVPTLPDLVHLMKPFITSAEAGAVRQIRNLTNRLDRQSGPLGLAAFVRLARALTGS